jgi:hypothetical protein
LCFGDSTQAYASVTPLNLLYRLGRAVSFVERYAIDLAPVGVASQVDHLEVRRFDLARRVVCQRRPAVGHGLTDLYLGVRDARPNCCGHLSELRVKILSLLKNMFGLGSGRPTMASGNSLSGE